MRPGKGVHTQVNEDLLGFVYNATQQLLSAYQHGGGDLEYDENPIRLFNHMKNLLVTNPNKEFYVDLWHYEEDAFGRKLYTEHDYPDGELRVTCVLNKRRELKLDIRPWMGE